MGPKCTTVRTSGNQPALEWVGICSQHVWAACPWEPQSTETCWLTLSWKLWTECLPCVTAFSHQHQQFNLKRGCGVEKAMSLGPYFCKGGRGVVLIPILWKTRLRAQPVSSVQLTDIEPGLDTSTLPLAPSSFQPDNQGSHKKNVRLLLVVATKISVKYKPWPLQSWVWFTRMGWD